MKVHVLLSHNRNRSRRGIRPAWWHTLAPAAIAIGCNLVTPQLAYAQAVQSAPSQSSSTVAPAGSESAFLESIAGARILNLSAQDRPDTVDIQESMQLAEAVAFALQNNYESQAANEKLHGAKWDRLGAYSEYLPSIEMDADTGRERSRPGSINDANGNRVLDNAHHRNDHNYVVRQPLIDLGIISDILSSRTKEAIAEQDRLDSREGIAFDTISAFLNLMQAQLSMNLAEGYKHFLDDLAGRMQLRVEGGGATTADLDRIKGRAANAESARIEARGDFQTNLAEFRRLTKVSPAGLIIPVNVIPDTPDEPDAALQSALASNPSYLSSLEKVKLANDDRRRALASLLPKIGLELINTYSFNAGGSALGNPVDGVWPTQKSNQLMLNLQWTISGGTSVASAYSGSAKRSEMHYRAMDMRERIEQGIYSGFTALNTARQKSEVLQTTVESNERVVAGFEEQFTNGSRSLFDLLDAHEQLYNARLNRMRVVVAHAKAAYQVRRLMGEIVPTILSSGR